MAGRARDESGMVFHVRQHTDRCHGLERTSEGNRVGLADAKMLFGSFENAVRIPYCRRDLRPRHIDAADIETAPRKIEAKLAGAAADVDYAAGTSMTRDQFGDQCSSSRIER